MSNTAKTADPAAAQANRRNVGNGPSIPVRVLRPSTGWSPVDFAELWASKEILYFLVWRDLKVRYRQAALGAMWAIVQPVLAVGIFTVFFGRFVGVPSDGIPYPVFALAAIVPWAFFANGVTMGTQSILVNEQLVRRIYFPRLLVPVGAVLSGSVDVMISMMLLLVLALAYGIAPTIKWLLVPIFLLLTALAAFGIAIILSALNVRYRDVQYVVPFFTQLLMFASPIVYPSSVLAEPWRTLYGINPMAGIIDGMRWALFGTSPTAASLSLSVTVSLALLVSGAFFFRRTERTFADLI
jgi:lipopolysaccharide transport system permease protein